MTEQTPLLLVDSDVLIAAYRVNYAPDYCPGFWDCLAYHLDIGRLLIIDPVRDEIDSPSGLVQWVANLPQHAFAPIDIRVSNAYRQIANWIQLNPQFTQAAMNKFSNGADGWLVAYAMVHNAIVVTNEVSAPDSENTVKIPDICERFGVVKPPNTQGMLRALGASFDWRGP